MVSRSITIVVTLVPVVATLVVFPGALLIATLVIVMAAISVVATALAIATRIRLETLLFVHRFVVTRVAAGPISAASSSRRHFRLSTPQVNTAPVHICLLHVLNQMLRNRLIFKSNKPEASRRTRIRVFNNLHIFDQTVLAEEPLELLLSQMVI